MSTSTVRISELDNTDTPDITDAAVLEIEDINGDSGYIDVSQLRIALGLVTATGDVTFSGYPGTSFAAAIATDVVGLPELTHGTANTLLGMSGAGVPAEIAAGSGITISGSVISASAPAASAPRATLFLYEEHGL